MDSHHEIFAIAPAQDDELDPDKYRFERIHFDWNEKRINAFESRASAKAAIEDSPSLGPGQYIIVEIFNKL